MQFHKVSGDGQSQARSAEFASSSALCLAEAFKDFVTHCGRNPRSAVLHGQDEAFVFDCKRAPDTSAPGCELERIGEQIEKYPFQLFCVDLRTNNVRREDDIGNRPLWSQSIEVRGYGAHQP